MIPEEIPQYRLMSSWYVLREHSTIKIGHMETQNLTTQNLILRIDRAWESYHLLPS